MRIDHSTEIAPTYQYKVNRDNEEDPNPQEIDKLEGDDLKPLPFKDMASLKNWVHFSPSILKEGRVKRKDIEEEDEAKKEQMEKERLKEDPYETRLKSISEDKCMLNSNQRPRPSIRLGHENTRGSEKTDASLQAYFDRYYSLIYKITHLARDGTPCYSYNATQVDIRRLWQEVLYPELLPTLPFPHSIRTKGIDRSGGAQRS